MDSDNNQNLQDKPAGASNDASGARIRTQSECSVTSDDGNSSKMEKKRQRTTSQQFMIPGLTSASPPKFVSLEEIMQAANSMRDMALVHHIAVDDNFKLEPFEPEENTIQKVVKETMHRAFWDLLRSQLADNPPCFQQALILLEDIKEGLFSLLLPQHTKIKQQISEVLDTALIKQQAEKGTLDFQHYAQYIISVMAKMCAPVRDEKIKQLTETTDVVDTFKGILETIDLMQLDMANFTIQISKPDIVANSVELERKKFTDFLAVQPDGLEHTRIWLLKHLNTNEVPPANVIYENYIRNITKKTFSQACIDLLDWDESTPYPETFMLDEERLKDLQIKTKRLIAIATVLLVTLSSVGADLQSISIFKQSFKEHISILLQSVANDKQFADILPNVAEQVVNDVKEAQKKYNLAILNEVTEKLLRDQILDIAKPEHRIRQLIQQRIKEFLLDIIESSTAAPQKVPSGLTALQKELTEVAGSFLRIVSHNHTVFCIYYFDIVSAAIPKPS